MSIIDFQALAKEGQLFLEHGYDHHIKAYIPSTYRDNHASNLVELKNGDLLCVWFAGLSEGSLDIKIAMSRLAKDSDHWSEPVLVTDDYERSEQNPVSYTHLDVYKRQVGSQELQNVRFLDRKREQYVLHCRI